METLAGWPITGPFDDLWPLFVVGGAMFGARIIRAIVQWINWRDDPMHCDRPEFVGARQIPAWDRGFQLSLLLLVLGLLAAIACLGLRR